MNIQETQQLLAEIAVIDGREISDEAVNIWYDILQNIPLDIAQEAHRLSRQDPAVRYLEPKHIYARAMQAARKLAEIEESVKRQAEMHASRTQSKPCPKCNHGVSIVSCNACCDWLYRYHKAMHDGQPYGDSHCTELMVNKRIPTNKTLTPLER